MKMEMHQPNLAYASRRSKGDIIIGAKIDDHESYGSLVAQRRQNGACRGCLIIVSQKELCGLPAIKTPLWLLIFPNLIIVTVWGIIFYLLYMIDRIIKLGKANDSL
jgi:hypothetical protein